MRGRHRRGLVPVTQWDRWIDPDLVGSSELPYHHPSLTKLRAEMAERRDAALRLFGTLGRV